MSLLEYTSSIILEKNIYTVYCCKIPVAKVFLKKQTKGQNMAVIYTEISFFLLHLLLDIMHRHCRFARPETSWKVTSAIFPDMSTQWVNYTVWATGALCFATGG